MSTDEDTVRTLLRESDIPPSRLDVDGLMSRGRRSRRRRRIAAACGVATVAVAVAVAVPLLPVQKKPPTEKEPSADFATTTRVVHRPTAVDGPPDCVSTPLRRVDGDDPGMFPGVFGADPSGERMIGSSRGGRAVTLWTEGEPRQFTVPDAGVTTATAVNGNGVVVGYGSKEPLVNFRYRDGDLQYLKTPDGYPRVSVTEVNDRGDALGVVATAQSFQLGLALVVWPAAQPDRPRVVAEPSPGVDMHPLAIRNDGTVIALNTENPVNLDRSVAAVVVYRPDGTQLKIDAPAEIGLLGEAGVLRGNVLFTNQTVETGKGAVGRPVRWNLKTGIVEVFTGTDPDTSARAGLSPGSLIAGNSTGWFVAHQGRFGGPPVLVSPNGKARTLPFAMVVTWVSSNGRTLAGITADGTAVTWRCPVP